MIERHWHGQHTGEYIAEKHKKKNLQRDVAPLTFFEHNRAPSELIIIEKDKDRPPCTELSKNGSQYRLSKTFFMKLWCTQSQNSLISPDSMQRKTHARKEAHKI